MPLDQNQQILQTQLEVPPLPGGSNCLKSLTELVAWLKTCTVRFNFGMLFGYTSGTAIGAPPESRGLPRYLFDDSDRFVGVSVWVPSLGAWTIAGVIGEIKTVQRTAITLVQDMADKNLYGWKLCDGSSTGVPDLTAKMESGDSKLIDPDGYIANAKVGYNAKIPNPFFAGAGPVWDRYSVMYIGTP